MADLKINGITYAGVEEVQIPLVDGSANAVFVPEINNSGMSNAMSGEFTLDADADSINITIPDNFEYFFFIRDTLTPSISKARNVYCGCIRNGKGVFSSGSGSGGGAPGAIYAQSTTHQVSLTDNKDGTYSLNSNHAASGGGYFTAGDLYHWVAWSPLV